METQVLARTDSPPLPGVISQEGLIEGTRIRGRYYTVTPNATTLEIKKMIENIITPETDLGDEAQPVKESLSRNIRRMNGEAYDANFHVFILARKTYGLIFAVVFNRTIPIRSFDLPPYLNMRIISDAALLQLTDPETHVHLLALNHEKSLLLNSHTVFMRTLKTTCSQVLIDTRQFLSFTLRDETPIEILKNGILSFLGIRCALEKLPHSYIHYLAQKIVSFRKKIDGDDAMIITLFKEFEEMGPWIRLCIKQKDLSLFSFNSTEIFAPYFQFPLKQISTKDTKETVILLPLTTESLSKNLKKLTQKFVSFPLNKIDLTNDLKKMIEDKIESELAVNEVLSYLIRLISFTAQAASGERLSYELIYDKTSKWAIKIEFPSSVFIRNETFILPALFPKSDAISSLVKKNTHPLIRFAYTSSTTHSHFLFFLDESHISEKIAAESVAKSSRVKTLSEGRIVLTEKAQINDVFFTVFELLDMSKLSIPKAYKFLASYLSFEIFHILSSLNFLSDNATSLYLSIETHPQFGEVLVIAFPKEKQLFVQLPTLDPLADPFLHSHYGHNFEGEIYQFHTSDKDPLAKIFFSLKEQSLTKKRSSSLPPCLTDPDVAPAPIKKANIG